MAGGRPKGSTNKIGQELKESFVKAFHLLQKDDGKPYALGKWAEANPDKFYPLISKLFPTEIEANLKGGITVTVHKLDGNNITS